MSSADKNLSSFDTSSVPSVKGMRFGLIVSKWNTEITEALYQGALTTLKKFGAEEKDIRKEYAPGSFELPLAAQYMAERKDIDAVICIGCVIQGETKHFNFISMATAQGITAVGIKTNKPIIFAVLTTDNFEQARERSGGRHGNKGDEAAVTAIEMLALKQTLSQ